MSAEYLPVPVASAAEIAERFAKDIVIVVAIDHAHGLFHTATFAKAPAEKELAHTLGEKATRAVGGDVEAMTTYEDFRIANKLPDGKSASEWLLENIQALAHSARRLGLPVAARALRRAGKEVAA